MTCIPLAILQDVLQVRQNLEEELIVTEAGKYFVIHNYRGYKFATQFEGDGIMHIYLANSNDMIQKLDSLDIWGSKMYDTHSYMSNPMMGYLKTLDSFI